MKVVFFAHLINNKNFIIFIKNDLNRQIEILRKFRFDVITKFDYKNCF